MEEESTSFAGWSINVGFHDRVAVDRKDQSICAQIAHFVYDDIREDVGSGHAQSDIMTSVFAEISYSAETAIGYPKLQRQRDDFLRLFMYRGIYTAPVLKREHRIGDYGAVHIENR